MDERINEIAKKLGATIIAELPDVGHGGVGAAHYAAFYRRRMEEIRRGTQPEAPETNPLQVSLDDATVQALKTISELLWPGQSVGSGQLAAGLLKGMSILILDQLIKQLEHHQAVAKKQLDAKAALIAALQEMIAQPPGRHVAG